jgi:hypothetical protein
MRWAAFYPSIVTVFEFKSHRACIFPKNLSGHRSLAPGRYFNSNVSDPEVIVSIMHISERSSSLGSLSLNFDPPNTSKLIYL